MRNRGEKYIRACEQTHVVMFRRHPGQLMRFFYHIDGLFYAVASWMLRYEVI